MADFELSPEEIRLFLEEANEQLEVMELNLLALENEPGNAELLQEVFRAAHTLKGGSAVAGFDNLAHLTHTAESILDRLRSGELVMNTVIANALLAAVDLLGDALALVEREGHDQLEVTAVVSQLEQAASEDDDHSSSAGSLDQARSAGGLESDAEASWLARLDSDFREDLLTGVDDSETAYAFTVPVLPEAALPSVRAYQAFVIASEQGEVLHTDPPLAVIEEAVEDVEELGLVVILEEPASLEAALQAEVAELGPLQWQVLSPAGEDADTATSAQGAGEADSAEAGSGQARGAGAASGSTKQRGLSAQSVRVDVRDLDRLMNLLGELVIDGTRIKELSSRNLSLLEMQQEIDAISAHLGRITGDLQDTILSTRMIPVARLFKKFPRLVRDMAQQLDKSIRFEMSGEETELDRSLISQISDPLVHLVRNAADHGLESPADRRASGKDEEGLIRLAAYHQESHIFIEVADDGRGLDPEQLKQVALERGVIDKAEAEQLDTGEAYELIFQPGFSTSAEVSEISGRGVGMDVVRRNIEQVGGSIGIDTGLGEGTTFTIKLPLTLAILQALLVEVAGTTYAIPLANVLQVLRLAGDDLDTISGNPTINVRGQTVRLFDPQELWGAARGVQWANGKPGPAVVIQSGLRPLALKVEKLLGEQEIVIKSMGPIIGDVPGISGASILGDGRVALIIDVPGLVKEVRKQHRAAGTVSHAD